MFNPKINFEELAQLLNQELARHNTKSFIANDPVQFAWRYSNRRDIEIVALLSSLLAWGRRDMILRNLERLFTQMGSSPFEYVMSCDLSKLDDPRSIHRTFNQSDLAFICKGLRRYYESAVSLEELFVDKDPFNGIMSLRTYIIESNIGKNMRSSKHLADPNKQSACKRLNLFLRWLVRKDQIVDLGIWTKIDPAVLYIPLDTHVARIGRQLNIITRKQNDKKTVEELTEFLRLLDEKDPIKYDLAIFGIGETNSY